MTATLVKHNRKPSSGDVDVKQILRNPMADASKSAATEIKKEANLGTVWDECKAIMRGDPSLFEFMNNLSPINSVDTADIYDASLTSISPSSVSKGTEVEPVEEVEVLKGCKCTKSKCLKRYCECFKAGVYCEEFCSCQDCRNKPEDVNKVMASSIKIQSCSSCTFLRKGCNCKNSSCQKQYCVCYKAGVGCSKDCRCKGCKNIFGIRNIGHTLGIGEAILNDVGRIGPNETCAPNMNLFMSCPLNMDPSTSYAPTMSTFGLSVSHQVENGSIVQSSRNLLQPSFQNISENELPVSLQSIDSTMTNTPTNEMPFLNYSEDSIPISRCRNNRMALAISSPQFPPFPPPDDPT